MNIHNFMHPRSVDGEKDRPSTHEREAPRTAFSQGNRIFWGEIRFQTLPPKKEIKYLSTAVHILVLEHQKQFRVHHKRPVARQFCLIQ